MNDIYVASRWRDLRRSLVLARRYRCGLEIQAFSDPNVLDGEWRRLLAAYQTQLRSFSGPLACHGAFFDMVSASVDTQIVALTRRRYLRNLEIAAALGATHLVFHTNFFPMIGTEDYRRAWIERQIEFWREIGARAAEDGVTVCLENMWDPDPFVLRDLLAAVASDNVQCCLDVSHIFLYGQKQGHTIDTWLEVLEPYIVHAHLNNTLGKIDEHLPLHAHAGVVPYATLLPKLAALKRTPGLVVEMEDLDAAEASLRFIRRVLVDRVPQTPD
ncbi:MAG: sugar phosphate isomerase/epimerase family protein [Anaerolineae bacterium]